MMTRRPAILALVIVALACNNTQAPMCTLEARAGINVSVIDAATGAAVPNATGTVRDGAYTESLQSFQPGSLFGAFEREGIYDVTVSAPGYAAWQTEDIVVEADECHVIPVQIIARLSR